MPSFILWQKFSLGIRLEVAKIPGSVRRKAPSQEPSINQYPRSWLARRDHPPVVLSSTAFLGLRCLLFHMVYGHYLPVPPIIPMFQLPCSIGGGRISGQRRWSFSSTSSAHGHLTVQTSLCCAGSFKSTTHVKQFISPKPIDFEPASLCIRSSTSPK